MSFNFNPLSNNLHMLASNAGNSFVPKNHHPLQQRFEFTNVQTDDCPMELESASEIHSNTCERHSDRCDGNSEMVYGMGMMQPLVMLPMLDQSLLGLQYPVLNLPSSTVTSSESTMNTKAPTANGVKEIIYCKSCTLIPPNPNQPPPTTRERPLGCKTCFVGGLPENITPEIIREIFERCGEIGTLRLSKKNFCHVRFSHECSVDSAISLSGYRVKIGNSNDSGNTGKLHVDFAQARDDTYEYECRQRQLERMERHKQKESSSPPLIVQYTEHEAAVIAEKIKNDDTFLKAVQILITWLERGECNKKNANIFYSMIQSTNSHLRRLMNEKSQYEDELKKANEKHRIQMAKMTEQFDQIEKVFNAASHKNKRVWDHFTKAQRIKVEAAHKKFKETKFENAIDDDSGPSTKRARSDSMNSEDRFESSIKNERSDPDLMTKQIKVLQETIRNLQTKLIEKSSNEKQLEAKITNLEESIRDSHVKELLLRTKIVNVQSNSLSITNDDNNEGSLGTSNLDPQIDETRLISLATAFLVIHPNGAEIESIHSYIKQYVPSATEDDVQEVLSKHFRLFAIEEASTSSNELWFFKGF